MTKVKIINGLPYHFLLKHPAPAYLQSALSSLGGPIEVSIADYTLDALRFLISEDRIVRTLNSDGSLDGLLADSHEFLDKLTSKEFLKDYDLFRVKKGALEQVVRKISNASSDTLIFDGNTFRYKANPKFSYKTREGVIAALEHRKENLFYDYLSSLSAQLAEERIDILGLSISDNYQIIPTLMLAQLVKEKKPGIKVVVGGDFVTRLRDTFSVDDDLNRKLFGIADVMIYGEGENTFPEIVQRIADGKGLNRIPKVIYEQNGHIVRQGIGEPVNCRALPAPGFKGIYNSKITPEPVPVVHSSRGCGDQKKCGFCGIGSTIDELIGDESSTVVYKRIKAANFANHILQVSQDLGTKTFSLTDLTLYPAVSRQIFAELGKAAPGLKIQWDCYAQIDKAFTDPEFAKWLAENGCRFMQFGVENTNEETLKKMDKARSAFAGDVLKTTAEAGIWNHVFYICGFPGSSLLADLSILPFLEEYGQYALTIKPNRFKLSRGSKAARNPEQYGLESKPTGDLDTNLQFNYGNTGTYQSHGLVNAVLRTVERWVRQRHGVPIGETAERVGRENFTEQDLEILSEYKNERALINPVARTYVYHQRLFLEPNEPYIFALKEFAEKIREHGSLESYREEVHRQCEESYRPGEKDVEDNKTIWNGIVGTQLREALEKFLKSNRPEVLAHYKRSRMENPEGALLVQRFPRGFNKLEDVVEAVSSIEFMLPEARKYVEKGLPI